MGPDANDSSVLTVTKLLEAKERFDTAVALGKVRDTEQGLCTCDHCFGDRLVYLAVRMTNPRYCLNPDKGIAMRNTYENIRWLRKQGWNTHVPTS